jgi:hypothetical protein
MIEVKRSTEHSYEVTVHGGTRTKHTVHLSDDYYHKLTGGRETEERLIERAFQFLLRHEPNTAILSTFDLKEINRYFPAFEKEISGGLGRF